MRVWRLGRLRRLALLGLAALLGATALAEPAPPRQQQLIRMLRQDCGSCHGLRLTGGLGPPLTRAALAERPLESLVATIYHGRPGSPMPGWRGLLSEDEAVWLAQLLLDGAPEEARP